MEEVCKNFVMMYGKNLARNYGRNPEKYMQSTRELEFSAFRQIKRESKR